MKEILKKLEKLEYFVRWQTQHRGAGLWKSVYKGSGAEFDKIAQYQLGDDPRWINWAATARYGGLKVLKNSFIEEKELPVLIVADLSPSMDFGTEARTKKRLLAEVSAVIAHSAWLFGDKIGFVGYSAKVDLFFPIRRSKHYKLLIPQSILDHQAVPGGASNLMAAFERLPKSKGLVFLVSDFQGEAAALHAAFKRKGIYHDIVAVIVTDPREHNLPRRGMFTFKDLETGKSRDVWLSRAGLEAFKSRSIERRRELDELLGLYRFDSIAVDTTDDYFKKLTELFLARRRRRL